MIELHKAKIEDIPEIKKLLHETWTTTYSDIYSPEAIELVTTEWHSSELLTNQINDPDAFFGVAKDKNKIVAICNASLVHEGTTINIQRLHVLPGYQRQGIGSQLTKEAIKAFPKATRVELEVEKQNHRAHAFYEKHGFNDAGEKTFVVNNIRIECLVMEKTL